MKGAATGTLPNAFNMSQSAIKSKIPLPAKIKGAKGPLFFEENEFKTLQIVRNYPICHLFSHFG